MSRTVAVRGIAHYLPDTELAVPDLPELACLPEAAVAACLGLGIDRIRADDELSAADLAAGAARQVLADTGLSPSDVDALIVVDSRAPQTLISSEPARLQSMIGAGRAITFGVGGLGCVSLAPAVRIARALLADDEGIGNVLVVHGSKPATPGRYRHPVTVNGDGGQAVLLARSGPVRILDMLQCSNGEYWDLFTVDFRDRPVAQWREECTDQARYSFRLAVETRNRLQELYRLLLNRNGIRTSDVDAHIGQNLSAGSLRFTEEALGVRIAKACYENLRTHGHLGPNDMLLNLTSAIESGELADGGRAVLMGASPVAAWSLMLVENGDSGGKVHYL
jgi:3-oxoacyl-[acyl-carrier-protein] synthase III